jgi:hypothetical protein
MYVIHRTLPYVCELIRKCKDEKQYMNKSVHQIARSTPIRECVSAAKTAADTARRNVASPEGEGRVR